MNFWYRLLDAVEVPHIFGFVLVSLLLFLLSFSTLPGISVFIVFQTASSKVVTRWPCRRALSQTQLVLGNLQCGLSWIFVRIQSSVADSGGGSMCSQQVVNMEVDDEEDTQNRYVKIEEDDRDMGWLADLTGSEKLAFVRGNRTSLFVCSIIRLSCRCRAGFRASFPQNLIGACEPCLWRGSGCRVQ